MPMQITPVVSSLNQAGLGEPVLRALVPDSNNYSVLLLQPAGRIEANANGVRHSDRGLADLQFATFLDRAASVNSELAVTPEYSMPWRTLVEAIKKRITPAPGCLWAIGCESIKLSELADVRDELAAYATVIYESLVPDPQRFVDPLAYVFLAPRLESGDTDQLTVLVQFKTCPMGDKDHFEVNALQLGTRVYQFGGSANNLRLISLICSDALEFRDEHATAVYDRAFVLHIQLNPKPRHDQYRQYRTRLLHLTGDQTEILCLNWAKDVYDVCGDNATCWKNNAASAWYLRPNDFDDRDVTLCANHRLGLYYTWLFSLRSHVLFFNYEPAVYFLNATKVAHIGIPAALSRRRGPQLTVTHVWDPQISAWANGASMSDGFATLVAEAGNAQGNLSQLASNNPFEVERLLAVCAGKIGHSDKWHNLRHLDSCRIEASEIIRRITFCQDNDPDAHTFRVSRLKRCSRLWDILKTDASLPPALADLKKGFRLEWVPEAPHQNVVSAAGHRATAIYMGEDADMAEIEKVAKCAAEYLHRTSPNPDASSDARQRLAVWHRNGSGSIELFDPARYIRYDDPRSTSEFDIARTT